MTFSSEFKQQYLVNVLPKIQSYYLSLSVVDILNDVSLSLPSNEMFEPLMLSRDDDNRIKHIPTPIRNQVPIVHVDGWDIGFNSHGVKEMINGRIKSCDKRVIYPYKKVEDSSFNNTIVLDDNVDKIRSLQRVNGVAGELLLKPFVIITWSIT